MTYDPCAHVNGLAKPTYIHHRVLGRLRPRHHTPGPIVHARPADPGIDAGCRRNVVLSKRTTFPPAAYKAATLLAVGGLTGGPTPPPIFTAPVPVQPTVPVQPVNPITPPHGTTSIPEPASLFLLLAGVLVLTTARRFVAPARA